MRTYPAKLLLFGEYVLLSGATALAEPLPVFSGRWVRHYAGYPESLWEKLMQFAESEVLASLEMLDVQAFKNDLNQGWVFESNIPIGYGLGSSGALCAAVFDRFALEKSENLADLKRHLAHMESYFHGASSGVDPLTSYVQAPLLIQAQQISRAVLIPWQQPPSLFLLDTKLPRITSPLVDWYLTQCDKPSFMAWLENEYLPAHEAMVHHWLMAAEDAFWDQLNRISALQLEYFLPMIPNSIRPIWQEGLSSGHFLMKICGAGGGGFMLGFTRRSEQLAALAERYPIIRLPSRETI